MKRALETSPELRMPDSCLNYQPSTSTWGPQTSSRRLLSSSTIPPLTGPADQDPLFHSKHSLTAHDKYHSLLATWTLLEQLLDQSPRKTNKQNKKTTSKPHHATQYSLTLSSFKVKVIRKRNRGLILQLGFNFLSLLYLFSYFNTNNTYFILAQTHIAKVSQGLGLSVTCSWTSQTPYILGEHAFLSPL